MNFLLDNPIAAIDGPAFLVLFIVFSIATLGILAVVRTTIDATDRMPIPAIPPEIDPFEIAYLRGGANELARSVVFSLIQKGYLEIVPGDKESKLRRIEPVPDTRNLTEIEGSALRWFSEERGANEVFDNSAGLIARVEGRAAQYELELARRQFLMPDEWKSRMKKYGLAAGLLLALVGAFKIFVAIALGNFNFIFLIFITLVSFVIAMSIGRLPRVTKLGKQYLSRVQSAFEDLKYRSQAPYIGINAKRPALAEAGNAGVDPLLLSVGVFGTGILAGTMFSNYNEAFARQQQAGSSCGSSCGSGCSSSCGSGDGGGGCGGGCGGCS